MNESLNLLSIERPLRQEKKVPAVDYPFNPRLIEDIKQAFMSASILSEQVEASCPHGRDYLFIKFTNPVMTSVIHGDHQDDNDVVAIIYSGDASLSKRCNQSVECLGGSVELGFRWFGTYKETKGVEIIGFSLKIRYPTNRLTSRETLFEMICRELENANFIVSKTAYKDRLLSMLSLQIQQPHTRPLRRPHFFQQKCNSTFDALQARNIAAYIAEHIPPVSALYTRENEWSINPTYQNSDAIVKSLEIDQKKIWLLRSDFILAVGNKNSNWTNFNDTELPDAIEEDLHRYVNWDDRYGHPSLATPHSEFDGSAFYGGYLAQREGYIEIYTFSGRYHRQDLDAKDKAILEAYIALHFQHAYGNQPVIFIDAVASESADLDNFELSMFINNHPLPDYCIRRIYQNEHIQSILVTPHVIPNEERIQSVALFNKYI